MEPLAAQVIAIGLSQIAERRGRRACPTATLCLIQERADCRNEALVEQRVQVVAPMDSVQARRRSVHDLPARVLHSSQLSYLASGSA